MSEEDSQSAEVSTRYDENRTAPARAFAVRVRAEVAAVVAGDKGGWGLTEGNVEMSKVEIDTATFRAADLPGAVGG